MYQDTNFAKNITFLLNIKWIFDSIQKIFPLLESYELHSRWQKIFIWNHQWPDRKIHCDLVDDCLIHFKLDGRFQKFFKMIEYCCIWSHPFDYFCEIRVILRSVTATDVNSNKDIFER